MNWSLVTGGSIDLGEKICTTLALEGHHLLVHYHHNESHADIVVQQCEKYGVKAVPIFGDFSTPAATKQFIAALAPYAISHLVNNVSHYHIAPALQTSMEEWELIFQVNLHAPFALIQTLAPQIITAQGSILNMGVVNINAPRANSHHPAYAISKSALLSLTKSVAKEMASHLVNVNMISPSFLENSSDRPREDHPIPMGKLISFDEVARLTAYLFRKENRHITGQNIEITGGW